MLIPPHQRIAPRRSRLIHKRRGLSTGLASGSSKVPKRAGDVFASVFRNSDLERSDKTIDEQITHGE